MILARHVRPPQETTFRVPHAAQEVQVTLAHRCRAVFELRVEADTLVLIITSPSLKLRWLLLMPPSPRWPHHGGSSWMQQQLRVCSRRRQLLLHLEHHTMTQISQAIAVPAVASPEGIGCTAAAVAPAAAAAPMRQ